MRDILSTPTINIEPVNIVIVVEGVEKSINILYSKFNYTIIQDYHNKCT